MTDRLADIRRLLPVLDMAFQAEQIKMAQINRRIESLRSKLRDIDRPATASPDPLNPSVRAGADVLWQAWAQDRKKLINHEMALAMRDREKARSGMAAALSKREAAKQLQRRLLAQTRALADRRSSW